MVQASALLVALAVTISPALAVPIPSCEQVREQAKKLTRAQIREMAKRAGLSDEEWAMVRDCLPKDKR